MNRDAEEELQEIGMIAGGAIGEIVSGTNSKWLVVLLAERFAYVSNALQAYIGGHELALQRSETLGNMRTQAETHRLRDERDALDRAIAHAWEWGALTVDPEWPDGHPIMQALARGDDLSRPPATGDDDDD